MSLSRFLDTSSSTVAGGGRRGICAVCACVVWWRDAEDHLCGVLLSLRIPCGPLLRAKTGGWESGERESGGGVTASLTRSLETRKTLQCLTCLVKAPIWIGMG